MNRQAAAAAIEAFLQAIGRSEPELQGTGERVAAMFLDELCAGYAVDTRKLVEDGVLVAPGSVIVSIRDVAVSTTCPHHLVPSQGRVTVAFKAARRVIGVGTIATLVEAHARRLALQEEIGEGVVGDLDAVLSPEWVGCRLVLSHACMTARGERAIGSTVETIALRGPPDRVEEAHRVLGVGV